MSFNDAFEFHNDNSRTLSTLLSIFNFLKSLNEDNSKKLNEFLPSIEPKEHNQTIRKTLEKFLLFIKNRSILYTELAENISSTILEPLFDFIDSYRAGFSQMLSSVKQSSEEIKNSRKDLEKLKQSYFSSSLKAEKAAQMANIEDIEDRIVLAKKNCEVMKSQMMKSSEEYLSAMGREKELWGEYKNLKKSAAVYLKELEDSRFQFIKRCMEKYSVIEKKELLLLNDFVEGMNNGLNSIGSEEMKVNLDSLLSDTALAEEKWVSYDKWKKTMKSEGKNVLKLEENYISCDSGYKPMDSAVAVFKSLVYAIIPTGSSDSHSSEKGSILDDSTTDTLESELFFDFSVKIMDQNNWETFLCVLESRKYVGYLEPNNMNNLASLIATITSKMMDEKQFNIEIFYKIIHFSHHFYTSDSHRVYLSKFLSTQNIFKSQKYWTATISYAIAKKLATEKALFKKTQQRLKTQGKKPQVKNKNSKHSVISSILSHFNFYMANLGTPIQVSAAVLSECAVKHKVLPDDLTNLVIELHSIQYSPPVSLATNKSLRIAAKERSRWGLYLHIGLASAYLPVQELSELLAVSKTWLAVISPYYYKSALLFYNNCRFRRQAWRTALFKTPRVSYSSLKAGLSEKPNSIKDVAEVIKMDIFRSFSQNPSIDSKFIEEVLKVYAFYKPKVGYCQGMHYLASTLSIVLGNNDEVFWSLDELIRVHQMQNLYGQDMNQLKVFFYILDRLVTLHVPEARQLFNCENIISSSYCVTWFITLFASQLNGMPNLLMRIWDFFIFYGWKVIFRVAVIIIKKIMPWISLKRFEEIMMILTIPHVSAKEIFKDDLIDEALKLKISNRLVNQLKKEYEKLKN